jgi:hypothetical protein
VKKEAAMGIHMDGLDEFKAAFERLKEKRDETARDVVRRHMEEDVFPLTQELVPVDTGALKATGRVEPGDSQNETVIWYGDSAVEDDAAVDYAAAVHEIEEHKHMPPTQAKFVQQPLEESVPRLQRRAGQAFEDSVR